MSLTQIGSPFATLPFRPKPRFVFLQRPGKSSMTSATAAKMALATTGLKPGMEVVDLCCGAAVPIATIARLSTHYADQLEAAHRRLTGAGATNCYWSPATRYELATLVSRPVGFVFTANAFDGVPDRPRLARAVREALAPGRTFCYRQLTLAAARDDDGPEANSVAKTDHRRCPSRRHHAPRCRLPDKGSQARRPSTVQGLLAFPRP
ncbi:hypothetical protein X757_32690 [Mesorhizobium sp. LSHC414A00]|nr:hypothetical protein X757_32690 [Mesorhizobium sp. LSHC414A00]